MKICPTPSPSQGVVRWSNPLGRVREIAIRAKDRIAKYKKTSPLKMQALRRSPLVTRRPSKGIPRPQVERSGRTRCLRGVCELLTPCSASSSRSGSSHRMVYAVGSQQRRPVPQVVHPHAMKPQVQRLQTHCAGTIRRGCRSMSAGVRGSTFLRDRLPRHRGSGMEETVRAGICRGIHRAATSSLLEFHRVQVLQEGDRARQSQPSRHQSNSSPTACDGGLDETASARIRRAGTQ